MSNLAFHCLYVCVQRLETQLQFMQLHLFVIGIHKFLRQLQLFAFSASL